MLYLDDAAEDSVPEAVAELPWLAHEHARLSDDVTEFSERAVRSEDVRGAVDVGVDLLPERGGNRPAHAAAERPP